MSNDDSTPTNDRGVTSRALDETKPWRSRYDRLWREAGDPPRPKVSRMGSEADVAARQWAAYVASQRPSGWR